MKTSWVIATVLLLGGCGPHYTIPNFETDEVEKVISSGRSPESCIANLKEDAQKLNLKVRLTDVHHEATSGPIAWIYTNSYTCTGKVVKTNRDAQKAL
ncbi:MAG TPA: hypothetical protein VFG71_14545 [Nitrospiraceae bacterium]|nr:hypothetical protein [Nitrospiraceae bacterium]